MGDTDYCALFLDVKMASFFYKFVTLMIVFLSTEISCYECEEGWHGMYLPRPSSSYYYHYCFLVNGTEKMDWVNSQVYCELLGAELAQYGSIVLDPESYAILGAFGYEAHN